MRQHWNFVTLGAIAGVVYSASAAWAASSLSNSLTGFAGDSTQAATQTAVALGGTGFEFTSTGGLDIDPPGSGQFVDPTVTFDSSGAQFGTLFFGDGGRNFMRTLADDFANHSFVAEVTWVTSNITSQAAYFGLGSAEYGEFRIADWGTEFSAVHLFLEINPSDPFVFTLKNDNTVAQFDDGTAAPSLDTGTNRLRMTYDWFKKEAVFAIDVNYGGGAFTADVTTPAVRTFDLYRSDGWLAEPARVYFGGDDGTTYKDFSVTVTQPGIVLGDLTGDGNITAADWAVLRANQHADLSGDSHMEAYFKGDLTADLANDHADFAMFKALYDAANGAGSFVAMAAGVPEPSAILLALAAGLLVAPRAVRTGR